MPRRMRAARSAESFPAAPPGRRSLRSPWGRFSALVRSATRSSRLTESRRSTSDAASRSTVASLSLREAASAVARASSPSFFLALPAKLERTRTLAESLGGTSTTDSPAATNLPARCLPRPRAFSMAQRRLGHLLAQRSRDLRPARSCGNAAHSSSSPLASSIAATANDVLWGSTPIRTSMSARTSVSVGPLPLACAKDIPTTSCGAHTSFEPLRPPRSLRRDASREQANPTDGRQEVRERSL
jgi:hypothetical protein